MFLDWVAVAVIVGGLLFLRRQIAALVRRAAAWVRVRPRPPLGLFLAITLSVVAAVLIAWKVPIWQLASRAASLAPDRYLELQNAYRATIVQALAGIALLVTIYLTWRRVAATERQVQIAGEGQITERFTRAIEQLGSEKLEVRLGGIYALERIARDSEKDHWPIMEVLTAYVRENAAWDQEEQDPEPIATDIQAILTVIGRRRLEFEHPAEQRLELSATNLAGAKLRRANLSRANLVGARLYLADLLRADLSRANLSAANLWGANLSVTDLSGADLSEADLPGVYLAGADLSGADLSRANLSGAILLRANLSQVYLQGADLSGAYLRGARLSRANLSEADLSRADLTEVEGLTREQIESAITDEDTILPDYLKKQKEGPPQEEAGGEAS